MRILADESIACAAEAFGALGEVWLLPGRAITREAAAGADVLLVRSVTRVNEALLGGGRARFVGTATSGFDHIDVDYLRRAGIAFAYAPGSNANSVAEYVVAALLHLSEVKGIDLYNKTVGIIGYGNVGKQVNLRLRELVPRSVINDPPLARTVSWRLSPLRDAFECDIITLHVPLTHHGDNATAGLVDEKFLANMKAGAILINTSRGGVVDEAALKFALAKGHLGGCVLDVWADEPSIDFELVEQVDLATPHIAGYSMDGKVNGTEMIHRALCEFLEAKPTWTPPEGNAPTELELAVTPDDLFFKVGPRALAAVAKRVVPASYSIAEDSARLREAAAMMPDERAAYFDRLRREYPARREFAHTRVDLSLPAEHRTPGAMILLDDLAQRLTSLGFARAPRHAVQHAR